jgi:hypothetical protein
VPRPKPSADWTNLIVDASHLWADAGIVVAFRSWRIMHGGAAAAQELERMLSEKMEAGFRIGRRARDGEIG